MTRTYRNSAITQVVIAFLFVMLASFACSSQAHAEEGAKVTLKKFDSNSVSSLEERLKLISEMKSQIEAILAKIRGGSASSNSTPNTPRNTSTAPAGLATSTMKVLAPNGGEKYVYRRDDSGELRAEVAQKIRYTTPKGMKSVDISLIKIGTSTSTHKKSAYGSSFIFGKGKHTTYDGYAHLGTVKLSGAGGEQKAFRWNATAAGDGYKIVITGKVDGVTYTDQSDGIFSMISAANYLDKSPAGGPGQR